FLVCGFLVKAAVVPFHMWLADAYAVAPAAICIVLAGAMSEVGVLGVVRVVYGVFGGPVSEHADAVRAVFVVAGLATAVLGALMAYAQDHLKRMLAFVTIAHVGLFVAGVAMLSTAGVGSIAVYVVADGCTKAALFACVGILQRRLGHVRASALCGRGRGLRFTGVAIAIGVVPGVRHAAHVAATQATAHTTAEHVVLGAAPSPAAHGALPAPPTHDWVLSVITILLAVGVAAFMLGRERLPRLTAL